MSDDVTTQEPCLPPVTRRWLAKFITMDTIIIVVVVIFSAGLLWANVEDSIADSLEDSSTALQASKEAADLARAATDIAHKNSAKLEVIEENQEKMSEADEKRYEQNRVALGVVQEDIKKILSELGRLRD